MRVHVYEYVIENLFVNDIWFSSTNGIHAKRLGNEKAISRLFVWSSKRGGISNLLIEEHAGSGNEHIVIQRNGKSPVYLSLIIDETMTGKSRNGGSERRSARLRKIFAAAINFRSISSTHCSMSSSLTLIEFTDN